MKYLLILSIKTVASGSTWHYYPNGSAGCGYNSFIDDDKWDLTSALPWEETIECNPSDLPRKLSEKKKSIAESTEKAFRDSLYKAPDEDERRKGCSEKNVHECNITIYVTQIVPLK